MRDPASDAFPQNAMTQLREQLQQTLGAAYSIERELGGGGMSRVFVAEETAFGRKVVVKVLPSEAAAHVSIERFKREIQLAARLQHPHIVPLHSAGESDGLPYFTMPFVEGESLRARLSAHGELPVSEALRVLREIASALAYAHAHGIVHRDIKPDNILLSAGSAMVTDFGVAKALSASSNGEHGGMTSLGVALGTPAYMAPEQASADPSIDHRADIYAFGVLAYEVLTGQPPFVGRSPQHLLAAHVSDTPESITRRRANLPPALASLVMRCLEKRAADRPQSAAEIVTALDAIVTPSGGMQPTSVLPGVAAPTSSSRRGVYATGVVALAAALGIGGWLASHREVAHNAGDRRIVVLPATTIGGTTPVDVADGIVEEVNSRLVGIRALEVIGRTSAERYRGTKLTPRQIGTELGVGYLLALRIGRDGDARHLRVNAELVRANTEAAVWSKPYSVDSTADNVRMQADIADQVARELGIVTAPTDRSRTTERPTENQEAYDEYLRGRPGLMSSRVEDLISSARALQHAVDLDPKFAAAWASLAVARIGLYWNGTFDPAQRKAAMEAAEHARMLAANAPETEFAVGLTIYWGSLDYETALTHMKAAVAASPGEADYVRIMGAVLRRSGRFQEALDAFRRAHTLSPRNTVITTEGLASTLTFLGRPAEAVVLVDSARAIDPDDYWLYGNRTDALMASGRLAAAESAAVYALEARPGLQRISLEQPFAIPLMLWMVTPVNRARLIAGFGPAPAGITDSANYYLARGEARRLSGLDSREDYAESVRLYERRVATQTPDPATLFYLLWAYRGAGRYDDALKAGQRSLSLYAPQHDAYEGPNPHIQLALTYLAMGDRDRAAGEAEIWARVSRGNALFLRYHPMYAGLWTLPRVRAAVNQ